jgi:hypothetical protein
MTAGHSLPARRALVGVLAFCGAWLAAAPPVRAADEPAAEEHTETIRGKIVWAAEAMKRLHGVESDPDALETVAALETKDGQLYPIIRDARGRGFYKDPRLFGFDVELVVRRYAGSPLVQVIRVYTWKDGHRFEFDYWCDICAIPMYELKECECCQGPIRFRFRPADPERK